MTSVIVAVLGAIALVLLVGIVIYSVHRKAIYVANLILSLALFLARTCVLFYITPINNESTRENQDFIALLRDLLPWFIGWIIISAVLVIVMNIIVPFIHANFAIQHTPPGEPDKVVHIKQARRSA